MIAPLPNGVSVVGCQVVVALIDTGFNFQHEDIQGHRFFWEVEELGGGVRLELGIRIRIYNDISDIHLEVCYFFHTQKHRKFIIPHRN